MKNKTRSLGQLMDRQRKFSKWVFGKRELGRYEDISKSTLELKIWDATEKNH